MQFNDGPIEGVLLKRYKRNSDHRGWLIELFRTDEMEASLRPEMAYFSCTHPGIARGPHEHKEQTDFFGFIGPSMFKVYLWDARKSSPTFGNKMVVLAGEQDPAAVIVPPGVVHAYRNAGEVDGWVFNAPNQLYAGKNKKEPVDEIRHENIQDSPYRLD